MALRGRVWNRKIARGVCSLLKWHGREGRNAERRVPTGLTFYMRNEEMSAGLLDTCRFRVSLIRLLTGALVAPHGEQQRLDH